MNYDLSKFVLYFIKEDLKGIIRLSIIINRDNGFKII